MASTFSQLKVELIGTGEESGTWGTITNVNLGTALEEAIVGRANANFPSDADLTISLVDSNATQVARNYILDVTSSVSLSATRALIVPAISKPYIVENNTLGGMSIEVKTATGTGVIIPNGFRAMVYVNSVDVVQAQTYTPFLGVGDLELGIALTVLNGGTGANNASAARTNLGLAIGTDIPSPTGTGASGTWGINISGTAATATEASAAHNITNTGGWSVTPTGTKLYFNYNGTNVGSLDSSGNFIVLGNVTAYGTV